MEILQLFIQLLMHPYVLVFFFAVIALFLFRSDIAKILERIVYAKYERNDKGSLFEVGAKKDETIQLVELEQNSEEAAPLPLVAEEENLLVDKDDWRFELLISCARKNPQEAEAAYKKTLSFISDEIEKKLLEIEYEEWKVRYMANTDAIKKLQTMVDVQASPVRVKEAANYALAKVRNYLREYGRSNEYYLSAIALSEDLERKVKYEVNIAENYYYDGQKAKAFNTLEVLLVNVDYQNHHVLIYETLASLHEKEGNNLLRALAAEKALNSGGENSSNAFAAGYSYSEAEFDELSLLHYQTSIKLGGDKSSINNLAVQYERLNMPIKSVKNYIEAEEAGETLSTANLAYRLLDAGFVGEAEERLQKAAKKEDVHQNVNEALSSIPTRRDNENKREEASISKAKMLQKFYLKYAEGYFRHCRDVRIAVTKFVGSETPVTTVQEGKKLTILWEEKLYSNSEYEWKYKAEAVLHNKSGEMVFYREDSTATYLKKETVYSEIGKGFVTITNDGGLILLKPNEYNKKDYKELELK